MRLSHRDFDALQRAALELHDYVDLETFKRGFPSVFMRLFPADYFLYNEFHIDLQPMRATLLHYVESSPRMDAPVLQALARHVTTHPFTDYFLKSGDRSALKTSDFFSLRKFRETPYHQEAQRILGVDYTMSISLERSPGTAAALNMATRGKDFTERDRLMLNLIRPHFDRAHRNAKLAAERFASGARALADYDLSPKETVVAHWLASGKTNPEIAIILHGSVRTIEKHIAKIIQKLGVENRTTAALIIARS